MFTIALLSFVGSISGYKLADIVIKTQAKKAGKVTL